MALFRLWRFGWSRQGVSELSPKLRRQLGWRFRLDSEMLLRLRYVSKRGRYAGEKTEFIRVFDPSLLEDDFRRVWRFDDLDERPSALLFEGRVNDGLLLHVSDLRSPKPIPVRKNLS